MSAALQEVLEWRGVEGLVAAEVLTDNDTDGYTTGDVFSIAGVATIERSTDSSNESHYYDNQPLVVISSTSADEVTLTVSAIPTDVYGRITGQKYDATTGALIEGPRENKYFAIGYKTKKNNGDQVFVWRFKGMFNVPSQTNNTENDSTDANGQEIVYTGISTTHKFTKNTDTAGNPRGAKALVVDVAKNLANVENFFDTVTTPDSLTGKTAYKLTITEDTGTTVTVKRGGVALANNADIYTGDQLTITVTGGTVTVNDSAFISGDIHIVAGNTAVVSTAVGG